MLFHEFAHALIEHRSLHLGVGHILAGEFHAFFGVPDDGVLEQVAVLLQVLTMGGGEAPGS